MRQKADKKAVVEEYLRGGVSLRELSREHGIKYQTLHRWVKTNESGKTGGRQEAAGGDRRDA